MIITISGEAGSGKSVVGEQIAKKLKYNYYCMGDVRRKMAYDMGISLAELNRLGETDKSTDTKVDDFQAKLGKTEDNFVMVGRTSFHFIPHSLKVFLHVSPEEGARRIMGDTANSGRKSEKYKNLKDAMDQLKERKASDTKRYQKFYKLDVFNEKNYDLYLDTTKMTIEEVVKAILNAASKKGKPFK